MSHLTYLPGPAFELRDGTSYGTLLPGQQLLGRGASLVLAAKAQVHQGHLSATLLSEGAWFNCMGLVFAARRGHVEIDDLNLILEKDQYRQVDTQVEGVAAGDVAVYERKGRASHVGVVLDFTTPFTALILSKWGQDGEYTHRPDDVPALYGQLTRFLTMRTRRLPRVGVRP